MIRLSREGDLWLGMCCGYNRSASRSAYKRIGLREAKEKDESNRKRFLVSQVYSYQWKPVRPEGKDLSDATKFFFREAYEQINDGKITLGESDVMYLRGASAAAQFKEMKDDLQTLIDAIEKFGAVEVWQEF